MGVYKDRSIFTAVPWPEDRGRIQQVIAGGNHVIVLTKDNRLWMCGNNDDGQLGLGDKVSCSAFASVNMKKLPQALQEVFTLHHTLHQLIKLGKSLMLTSGIASDIHHSQCQPDEPDGQLPLKKLRL